MRLIDVAVAISARNERKSYHAIIEKDCPHEYGLEDCPKKDIYRNCSMSCPDCWRREVKV